MQSAEMENHDSVGTQAADPPWKNGDAAVSSKENNDAVIDLNEFNDLFEEFAPSLSTGWDTFSCLTDDNYFFINKYLF